MICMEMTYVLKMSWQKATRPILSGDFPKPAYLEIVQAQEELAAKRKLTRILRSKATSDMEINVEDIVQILI